MKEITKEWVSKAEGDFTSADLLMHAGEVPLPDYVCFHCQQCAEKYLKAWLQEHDLEFERKHDLLPLLLFCMSLDEEFKTIKRDLERLDRYAVVVRYPGVIIKTDTAEEAIRAAGRVRRFVREKLGIE